MGYVVIRNGRAELLRRIISVPFRHFHHAFPEARANAAPTFSANVFVFLLVRLIRDLFIFVLETAGGCACQGPCHTSPRPCTDASLRLFPRAGSQGWHLRNSPGRPHWSAVRVIFSPSRPFPSWLGFLAAHEES